MRRTCKLPIQSSAHSLALASALAISFAAASSAAAQTNSDTTRTIIEGPIGMRVDSTLSAMQKNGFSGVALVAKGGRVVLKKGYGLANRATNLPIAGNSVIQIGSNTKDFTIVALLQLQERGKLSLGDSITKFLPNVPADKRGITINQLLNHRAGFDQHLGGDWDVISRDEEIRQALAAKSLFTPGTERKYSNIGYSLLAAIIEIVSGSSYDVYVRDNILKPLALTETGYLLPNFNPARVVHGYRDGKDAGTFLERPHAADGPYWNLRGNGGMLSTVSDMYRFYRALMSDGPLLKPASRNLFFHPDEPVVLAGSDLTFFFFYSRFPGVGLDIFLSTSSTDIPAMKVREALDIAAGAPVQRGGPGVQVAIDTGPPAGGRGRGAAGASTPNAAPVEIPDTPAGRGLRRFLAIYSSADLEAARKFFETDVVKRPDDTRTIADRVATMREMHDNMRTLTAIKITSSSEYEISVLFRTGDGEDATFTLTVEQAAPFRMLGLRIER
ncbi:MAG: serine hydrolase domain-containing protein [Gemmatimonadaceae bacterium]